MYIKIASARKDREIPHIKIKRGMISNETTVHQTPSVVEAHVFAALN